MGAESLRAIVIYFITVRLCNNRFKRLDRNDLTIDRVIPILCFPRRRVAVLFVFCAHVSHISLLHSFDVLYLCLLVLSFMCN